MYAKGFPRGPIVGRLPSVPLKAHSEHFGEIELRPWALASISNRNKIEAEMSVVPDVEWLDTGIIISPGRRLLITATGEVDLWPQAPGGYMATPKGWTAAGKDSRFMAGSLVGKLGRGDAFYVGERLESTGDGKLYLWIVRSPWNNVSAGEYRVKIAVE